MLPSVVASELEQVAADAIRTAFHPTTPGFAGLIDRFLADHERLLPGTSRNTLKAKAEQLLQLLAEDPFRQPPPEEVLVGDLRGALSRRINIQHRLVYQVLRAERVVKVLRLWTHYA